MAKCKYGQTSLGRHIDLPGIFIFEASVCAVKMANVLALIGSVYA
jgi:hypothetical protein